jgi:hypothetical protein
VITIAKRANAQKSKKHITHTEQFANPIYAVDEHGKVVVDRYWDVVTEGYTKGAREDKQWPQKIA